ncbi:DNA topology modulation protein FlaR [Flavimaricola marinus]|uniref:Topology modulation protein n=1 Tax=Flavimaricola marinus TaxID=1819565 RepID=A0A238LJ27_9RHOB|nr:DNA topology modulation protein FlaR [Flavimaricola marinus]SMY09622.1 topology modulation protein [Flavimaricola marinus]
MISRPSDLRGPFVFQGGTVSLQTTARIIVTGANGAGKSWLATRLGQQLDQPVIHKDALALRQGWRQRPKAEVQSALAAQIAQPQWVLDTGPTGLTAQTLSHATLVIWLDPPPWTRFRRVLSRSLRYIGRTRPEHPPGNRDWPGLRQWRFLIGTVRNAGAFEAAISQALGGTDTPVLRLTDRHAAQALLGSLQTPGEGAERL